MTAEAAAAGPIHDRRGADGKSRRVSWAFGAALLFLRYSDVAISSPCLIHSGRLDSNTHSTLLVVTQGRWKDLQMIWSSRQCRAASFLEGRRIDCLLIPDCGKDRLRYLFSYGEQYNKLPPFACLKFCTGQCQEEDRGGHGEPLHCFSSHSGRDPLLVPWYQIVTGSGSVARNQPGITAWS